MRNVCHSGLVLVVLALGCRIDPLPPRDLRDAAAEARAGADIDTPGLDMVRVDSAPFDTKDSPRVDLGGDSASDSALDIPLASHDGSVDNTAQAGPETRPVVDVGGDAGTGTGPEPGRDGATMLLDADPSVAIDGSKDTAADAPIEVGPDVQSAFLLEVSKTGAGKGGILSSPPGIDCGSACSASFAAGTMVTLTPTADATSTFVGWSGSCSGTGVCTVTVDAAKAAIATFDVLAQGLSVAKTGAGNGAVVSSPSGINCGSTCAANFTAGTQVTLTATPDGSSVFVGWSGVCTGIGACALTIDQPRSVTAIFVKAPGAACTSTGQCQAGLTCLDDVCCTQATCPQCRNCGAGGLCNTTVADAADGSGTTCGGTNTCNASGACTKRNGETCDGPDECASGSCTDNRCCNQSCGTCQACTGPGGTCAALTSADDPDNCTGDYTCDATGACKKKPGQVCDAGTECGTGNCLDGVCCTSSSCPQCQNCGGAGTCSISVTSANDTTGATCSVTNTCDASSACKKADGQSCSEGTECASGNCSGSVCAAASTWNTTTAFNTPRTAHTAVAYNGYLYVLGGTADDVTRFNDVQFAPIKPDGSLGMWQSATSFNTGRRGHTSVARDGYLYVIGGTPTGGGMLNDVQYAPINPNGSLGTWQSTTSFATGRLAHTSVIVNGYLYVIQGFHASAASPLTDVQFAKFNADGSLGAWQSTTSFAPGRWNHGSIAYNGCIYSMGGSNWNGSYYELGDAQYAVQNVDGSLSDWHSATPLSQPLIFFGLVEHNGYLLIVAGVNVSGAKDHVEYVKTNSDGSLGTWQSMARMDMKRYSHVSVVYNGYLYVIGGADVDGHCLNDVQYQRLGTLGSSP